MSRTPVTAVFALLVLALPVSTVLAQAPSGVPTKSRQGIVKDNVPTCQGASGGSRVRANCEPEKSSPPPQQSKIVLDAPPPPSTPQCEATTTTNYSQKNTVARVDGTISLRNCKTGSTGTYNLVLRIKDESGEFKSLEFSDKWQRSDDQDVKFKADYPIGENVDLVNVRLRDLRCTCAEAPAAAPADAPSNPPNEN